jgi:uncharacterized glyoxalase superfamily protein PhnB
MSEQAPAPTVWANFQSRDARAMIRFLVALGFEETAVYGEGERVDHAQLDWPEGGGVMFGSHKPEGEFTLEPGTAGMYVVTADPHAVHERAVAVRAEITRKPRTTDYGSTEFGLRDPDGNEWSFGTYRGEPRRTAQDV